MLILETTRIVELTPKVSSREKSEKVIAKYLRHFRHGPAEYPRNVPGRNDPE